jgi:hypothetical protein
VADAAVIAAAVAAATAAIGIDRLVRFDIAKQHSDHDPSAIVVALF